MRALASKGSAQSRAIAHGSPFRMAYAAFGLLDSISEFCRRAGMAESTFGRRAVNDGKFVARLRDGARIMPETFARISSFIVQEGGVLPDAAPPELRQVISIGRAQGVMQPPPDVSSTRNFRFFDNRQKYLLFVNTCSEKS